MESNTNNTTDPPSWGLSGTESNPDPPFGTSRDNLSIGRRDSAGVPRPPPRNTALMAPTSDNGKAVADPVTLGFERMMDRFDKLESRMGWNDRRVDRLESNPTQYRDQPYNELDDAELEYTEYRDQGHAAHDFDGRTSGGGGVRNRWGLGRGGRGEQLGFARGRGGRHQLRRGGPEFQLNGHGRFCNNWDSPKYRHSTWGDEEYMEN